MKCVRTCCTSTQHELAAPMFDLSEPPKLNGVTTASLMDVSRTFSPRPRCFSIAAKIFLTAWVIAIMVLSIEQTQFPNFWLAYLTHWGWTVTVAYFVFSLWTAFYWIHCEPDDDAGDSCGILVKITWSLFSIALPGEVVICLLFWVLEFDGTLRYVSMMVHGLGIVLLVIDGLLINRIPLRLKQFFLFEEFSALYVLWSVAFSYSGLGNPYKESGAQDDDAIYSSMKWKTDTTSAVIVAALALFVANPIFFLFCRAVSRIPPRRLVDKNRDIEVGDM